MAVTIGHVDVEFDVILRARPSGTEYNAGSVSVQLPVTLDYVPGKAE